MDTGTRLPYIMMKTTFIKIYGIKDRLTCLYREYVDNAYVRCLEQDFEPGSSHVYLKIVTEGLKRSFYINGTVVGVLDHVTSLCSEGLKKRKSALQEQ